MSPSPGESPTVNAHQRSVRPYVEHSNACQDLNSLSYEEEHIGECVCRPNLEQPPPPMYELWWCEWCGQEASEGSDPCQECGSPATRKMYAEVTS